MNILLLTQYYTPEVGAAQARLEALSQELIKSGHGLEVLTAMPNYPHGRIFDGYQSFAMTERLGKILVRRFWVYASQGKGLGRLFNYLSFTMTCFFAIFQKRKPDLIFVNSGPLFLGIPGVFFSWWYSCPLVFNVSDLWPRSVEHLASSLSGRIFIRWSEALESWIYKKSDFINAITEGVQKILIEEKKVPAEKILFLPNGVDLGLFSSAGLSAKARELKRKMGLEDHFIFIYPGNHGFAHALEFVLEAAELVSEAKVHFFFIGGGSEKPRLQEMALAKGLTNVTFHEPVPMAELPAYLLMADAGLVHLKNSPLAEETRPAKLFPLMAAKLPILFCGFGEGRGLLQKQQGEWIVDPERPDLMAEKIMEMMNQREKLKLAGEENYRLVKSQFSTSTLIQNWFKRLQHLMGGE